MRTAGLGLAVACAALGACRTKPAPGPVADASPAGPTSENRRAISRPAAEGLPRAGRPPLPCRIIAAEGLTTEDVAVDGGTVRPLGVQRELPQGWLTLGASARLVAKDPRTTRETTFHGPARVRDCVGGAEEAWVATGTFESTAGAGEAPGAEEWVVTPSGVVRYAAAKLRVDVRGKETTVTMVAGVAFAWPPAGATQEIDGGWQRLATGDTRLPAAISPSDSVDRCTGLASRARDLAAGLLAAPDTAGAVASQVTTRRLARAACSIAGVQVQSASRGEAGGGPGWIARLAEADAAWRALPLAPPTP